MNNVNKWTIILIAGVVALIAFLFLPLASASMGGTEIVSLNGFNYISGEVEASYMGQTQTVPVEMTADVAIIIIAAALVIFAGYKKNVKLALCGGVLGFIITLMNIINATDEFKSLSSMGASASVGFGFYLVLIAFAAAAYFTWAAKKEEGTGPAPAPQQFTNNQQ